MSTRDVIITSILTTTVFWIFSAIVLLLTSCTYNISMVHTEGTAQDVIDSNQSATPDIDANLSIPAKAL